VELFGFLLGLEMSLKSHTVLMLCLKLGFQLFNKQLEAADFISQFLYFCRR
jgi:hypothetical protein